MPLNKKLAEKLNKRFAPNSRLDDTYQGLDLTFITNELGEPVTLFIGKRRPDGAITGERYVRTIKRATNSDQIESSHWDLKGKVTRS
ncbi:MAG: hypothetical protein M3142_02665 [Bacteroidota bacterium]|nr:hypothetical protein [Bacteroidota bacterium]